MKDIATSQVLVRGFDGNAAKGKTVVSFRNHLQAATLLLCAFCLFASPSEAQTNPAATKVLKLEDALNYALEHYPAVRASLEEVTAAHNGVSLARTQYLPQLSGVYQVSRATQNQVPGIWLPTSITPTVEGPIGPSSDQSYWGSQGAALFSWEPFDFGLRSARVGQARTAEDRSRSDLALTQLQVAGAVGNYFLLVVADQQTVQAAEATVERWQVFDKSTHVLVDNELRPGADASRADAELARAKTRLYQAEEAQREALDTLASLMGAAGTELQLDGTSLLALPQTSSLAEAAASGHPLARAQMAAVRQTQSQEKILQHSDYPRFLLQGEGFARGSEVPNNNSYIGNWNGAAPARGNWIAGVTILFPDVFSLKARNAQEQIIKADERSQLAHYDQTIQDLTGQVRAARDRLQSAELIAQQTPVELAAARQTETQSRTRYQSGLATVVEVAEAENLLAQAAMDDAVARLAVWRGLFGVAYAQGNLQSFLELLHDTQVGAH
jgi:outer membrane protein TolC